MTDPTSPTDPAGTTPTLIAPPQEPTTRKSRLGKAALVLGIIGVVFALIPPTAGFGIFLGILGVVLGIFGLRRKADRAAVGTVVAVVAVVLGGILSGVHSGSDEDADSALPAPAATQDAAVAADSTGADEPSAAAEPAAPEGSVGQLQALAAAKGYLSSGMGFSQAGLLGQLTSAAGNGFDQADAQWAIDHAGADWDAQASASAKGYLDSGMGFSEASLIAQLTSSAGSQFTPEQAQAAVARSGADWNAQAVAAAKGYTESGMGFSRSSLIDQLSSSAGNQFTPEQAAYAADQVGLS